MTFRKKYSDIWKDKQMNTEIKEYTTEISGISSLSELIGAELGEPCLLIIKDSKITGDISDDIRKFFTNAPFLTALADDTPDEETAKLFDMVIPSEGTDDWTARLFKDKTKWAAAQITACFVKARTGTAAEVLDCESRAFYRLMAVKNGGSSNE